MVVVSGRVTVQESAKDPMVTEYVVQASSMVVKVSSLVLESLLVIYSSVFLVGVDALDENSFEMALFDSNSMGNNFQPTALV